LSSWSRRSIR